MEVIHFDFQFFQVRTQIFRHPLCERSHEHALFLFNSVFYSHNQVVYLPFDRLYRYRGIHEPRRPNDLLHDFFALVYFERSGRSRSVNRLADSGFEFFESQRPVIGCRRQAEAVVYKRLFARSVAREHSSQLRDGHVGFVYHGQKSAVR